MKAEEILNGRYVVVKWQDEQRRLGWEETNKQSFFPPIVTTIGRVCCESDDTLVVTSHYCSQEGVSPSLTNGVTAIRKGSIKGLYNVTEVEITSDESKSSAQIDDLKHYIKTHQKTLYKTQKEIKQIVLADFASKVNKIWIDSVEKGILPHSLEIYHLFHIMWEERTVIERKKPLLQLYNSAHDIGGFVHEYMVNLGKPHPNKETIIDICGGGEFPFLYVYEDWNGEIVYELVR